ncbi:hypothetical protein ACHAWF_005165 [Thalassiosira exigua]
MSSNVRKCNWCESEVNPKSCQKCQLLDYCGRECQFADWKAGHKILCSKVPKAAKKATEKIDSFQLSSYTIHNIGTFMVTEAQARRGEIVEEREAQDMCYNAMEMVKGSPEKLEVVLRALDHFPLSTEAWGMLGHFYQYEVTTDDAKLKKCSAFALKMYDNAIVSARKLNPTWTEDRSEEWPWGEIDNRPYLRSLSGRAIAFKNMSKRSEAIAQAKRLMRLNPHSSIRDMLCTWFLEARDTEGCTNLLRRCGTNGDTSLSFADVLLQYIRWKKDDAVEKDVKKALYEAMKVNPYVPDLLGVEGLQKDDEDPYYSFGSMKEAELYVTGSRKLWKKHQDAIDYITMLKYIDGVEVPDEEHFVDLLKSGTKFQMKCIHTNLAGSDLKESTVIGTQKRNQCVGRGLETFFWPRQLNRPHELSGDILFHNNLHQEIGWRKTNYGNIKEVPYWRIFLQFCEDDADNDNDDSEDILPSSFGPGQSQRAKYESVDTSSLKCKECNSSARFCALDNECTEFYCSKSCMSNFLQESKPTFFDLKSSTMKVHVSSECSIHTVSLDDAFLVASEHMPNLNSVDVYIDQSFLIKDEFDFEDNNRNIILSPDALKHFFDNVKTKLVSFSFRLDDCCWENLKL